MSNCKIRIRLKGVDQICSTKDHSSEIAFVPKEKNFLDTKTINDSLNCVNGDGLIDLKLYCTQKNTKPIGNTLIINVFNSLVEHTEDKITKTTGTERSKHQFRCSQFRKAIATLLAHPFEIVSGSQAKHLDGIGKGIADRIDEIIKTGTLSELNEITLIGGKTFIIKELMTVTGIGEFHAKKFVEQGVLGVSDLREKVEKGLIKITHHMQVGLQYYEDFREKIPFDEIVDLSKTMKSKITKIYPELLVEVCGSHRRKKTLSGDIDVLITHPAINSDDELIKSKIHYLKNVVGFLHEIGFIVADLTSQGDTKYMGVCMHPNNKLGRRIDIRFVTYDSYYPALLYFTGSMLTNKLMRTIALEKGYTLNEYGLYHLVNGSDKGEKIVVNSEKEIFDILGIVYLNPTEREI